MRRLKACVSWCPWFKRSCPLSDPLADKTAGSAGQLDARLYERARAQLVALAREAGVGLRHTDSG